MTPIELQQAKAQAEEYQKAQKAHIPTKPEKPKLKRSLPKYIHFTDSATKPYRVAVRRNGINRRYGVFATLAEAQIVASALALTPGVHTIRGKRNAEPTHPH